VVAANEGSQSNRVGSIEPDQSIMGFVFDAGFGSNLDVNEEIDARCAGLAAPGKAKTLGPNLCPRSPEPLQRISPSTQRSCTVESVFSEQETRDEKHHSIFTHAHPKKGKGKLIGLQERMPGLMRSW
jgi:hypothetical protein